MKKFLLVFMTVMMLVLTMSCSSNDHKVAMSQNKGVEGKNGIKRPDWVVRDVSDKKTLYAAGYGKGSTFELSMKKAKLEADGKIALYVSNLVEATRERTLKEVDNNAAAIEYIVSFVSHTKELGRALLSGVREEDFWEDNDGGVWILVSIPKENIEEQIEHAIETAIPDHIEDKDPVADRTESILDKNLDELLEK